MPSNFRYIGLIRAAFPEAKIIHVHRDPKATCWSNYMNYFSVNSHGYCYDLRTTVDYYLMYKNLMDFWNIHYQSCIYNLDYECLVQNANQEIEKLLNYLCIKMEKACLNFHKNKRSVRTASQQQVRKKIYSGSSMRWRNYEKHIGSAFERL